MKFQKNYKIPFLNFLLFCFSIQLFSQQSVIQGIVKDSLTQETITYAAIYLRNDKDSVVSYVYTDEQGRFELQVSDITKGSLFAEMLGYNKWTKTLDFSEETRFFEQIFLSPNVNLLGEIEISDSANKVVHRLDRDIHVIDKQLIEKSQNIYDILKTLPGVVVDEASNTIRFKGSAPEVLVDNFPAGYMYPDLRIIDINNIEKIELIDKSSIYGGAGEGGIINIKMKKEKRKTFGSYLGTNLTYDLINNDFVPQYNIINLNSNLGKAMLFNNLQMSTYFNNSKSNSTGNFIMNETFYEKETESTSTYRNTDFSDIIGIIFPLGKAQMIIADQVRFAPIHGETNLSQNTFIDTTFNNIISQKEKTNINVFQNFEYIKFSLDDYKNQDLEFSFYHVFAKLFKDNLTLDNISATYYNNSLNINESSYEIKGNGKIALFIYDLKYIYRLSESSQINFHGYFTDTYLPKYLKKHFLYNIINSEFEEDLGGSIKNLSTGLGYAKRFNRFSIDATVNYHFQNIMGHLTTNKNNNDTSLNSKITYHNVEPSIRFKYLINDKNNFNLGYSYSVSSLVANDPNITIYKYIDYIDKSNPTSWTSGNSKLKQELYHKVYFSYKFYKDNINFSTEIFYSATKNGITNISIPINSAIDLTMPENMAFNNRIGTDLSLYYKMSERWNLWLDSQIYHSTFKTNSLDRISEIYQISQDEIIQKSFGANASATIQYKFKAKKIGNPNVYLWADYNSKEITFTGYGYPYFNTNIAFQSNFFNNKLTVWLALTNFFSSLFHQKSYYEYLDVISKTDYYKSNNNMTIKLSLGYNLFAGERGTKDYKL